MEKAEGSGDAVNKFSLEEVKKHNAAGSSWLVIHNQVFDVTKFLDEVSRYFYLAWKLRNRVYGLLS